MFETFTLVIPVDTRFRTLAPDLAGRLAELAGGTAATLSAMVTSAVEAVADGAAPTDAVRLRFRRADGQVVVDLDCGSRTRTITCPL